MKSFKKYILSTFAVLACTFMLTGCGGDKQKVLVCTPKDKYNEGNKLQLELADDGKTIEKFIYQEGYTKAFIDHWFPDADLDDAYNKLSGRIQAILTAMTEGITDATWLDAKFEQDKENYTVKGTLTIDVTADDFVVDDGMLKYYLSQIGFDKYYNKDEKRFEVDPAIIEQSTANTWIPLACEMTEVKAEK